MENSVNDLYSLFRERAEAVSARVVRVTGRHGAAAALAEIVEEEKAEKIVAAASPMV